MTAHKTSWLTANLLRSLDGMLAHAKPSCAHTLLTQPVCVTDSHLAGRSSIRKRGSHYSSGHVLRLKCSK